MRLDTLLIRAAAGLLAFAAGMWLAPRFIVADPPTDLQIAAGIERYTWTHLAAPYPTGRCEESSHLAYAREPGASIADHWYVSSQLMATVALARATDSSNDQLDCIVERSFAYLERLWQDPWPGGYAPRSDLDGANVTIRDLYADDNALAGVAMLEAAGYVREPDLQERMLRGAERAARYLIDSGLWDDAYGGGFWWNTQREQSEGGKPVQTAGLAAQLFARLYRLTDKPEYRRWAELSMAWSNRWLWDQEMGLYRFGFRDDPPNLPSHPEFVSYDQSIMIEAHLAMLELGDAQLDHLARARTLARGLELFRSPLGGYEFELGRPQVFSHYSAWSSIGLIKLYEVDRDPAWLEAARQSLRDLKAVMVDETDGGVYYGVYACIAEWISDCPPGASSAVDARKVHLAQSWTERAFALMELARKGQSDATAAESSRFH